MLNIFNFFEPTIFFSRKIVVREDFVPSLLHSVTKQKCMNECVKSDLDQQVICLNLECDAEESTDKLHETRFKNLNH